MNPTVRRSQHATFTCIFSATRRSAYPRRRLNCHLRNAFATDGHEDSGVLTRTRLASGWFLGFLLVIYSRNAEGHGLLSTAINDTTRAPIALRINERTRTSIARHNDARTRRRDPRRSAGDDIHRLARPHKSDERSPSEVYVAQTIVTSAKS